jgi:hypothetical protein
LPPTLKDIADFRNHIKNHYNYFNDTASDNIVIKDNESGEIIRADTLISELAGNDYDHPYPVEIAGMPLSILSLIGKVFSKSNTNNKALTIGSGSLSLSSASSSSAWLHSKESGSHKLRGMVSSLVPSQRRLLKTSTSSIPSVKKNGGKTAGVRSRRRVVADVDKENEFE